MVNKKDEFVKVKTLKPLNVKGKTICIGIVLRLKNDENLKRLIEVKAVEKVENKG